MTALMAIEALGVAAALIYGLALIALATYALHSLYLLALFVRHRPAAERTEAEELERALPPASELPHVLVQLPVFNERDVVGRVVDAAARLRWPRDRFTVQLLDDGTDDSVDLGAAAIARLRAQGIDAHHVRRDDRTGFKAGALEHGMTLCPQAEYIAIFDADFVPHPDFLERAYRPFVGDDNLALVQGRWEHLNADESLLTAAQALGIDGHFAVEQGARAWGGLAMNFNGTCGLWRRTAIEDAGGWEHDTLTEDLDLSYRVQLGGWRCTYRLGLDVPGELPADVHAWRTQQFRWAKGSQQATRKLAGRIWRSGWPLHVRLSALLHTSHYAVHPLIVASLIAAPVAATLAPIPPAWLWGAGLLLLLLGILVPIAVYGTSQRALGRSTWSFLRRVPVLAGLGTGIALSNAHAVVEAWSGRVSPFVRTPKRGDGPGSYRAALRSGIPELLAGGWALFGIARGFAIERAWVAPLMFIYASGFVSVGWMCIRSSWRGRRRPEPLPDRAVVPEHTIARVVALGLLALTGFLAIGLHPGTWVSDPTWYVGWGLVVGLAYLGAAPAVRRSSPLLTGLVLAFALAFRIAVSGVAPSDDLNRYVVEAAMVVAGENPYAVAPADPITRSTLHGVVEPQIQDGVNHPEWTAIYPPVALGIQAAIARISPTVEAQRLGAAIAEGLAVLVVLLILIRRRRPAASILLVAWNPVTILWIVGEGHNDSYSMLALALAAWAWDRRRELSGIVAASVAALCKPFAVVALAPMLGGRMSWRWLVPPALAALAFAPFFDAGVGMVRSFGRFGTELHFSGALEPWIRAGWTLVGLGAETARTATVATLGTILVLGSVSLLRRRAEDADPLATVGMLITLLLLCLPTLHPWYLSTLVVFLPFVGLRALLWWTAIAPVHWLHGLAMDGGAQWAELASVTALTHLPIVAMLAWEGLGQVRREKARAALGVG